VACRAVQQAAHDLVVILGMLKSGKKIEAIPQKSFGKLFTNRTGWPRISAYLQHLQQRHRRLLPGRRIWQK